jgi:hypothetical protein
VSGRHCPSVWTVALYLHAISISRLGASGRLNWCTQFPYMKFEHPDHEEWRPDGWTLYARLALWRRASGRERTSSGRLQLSFHICVLERNPIVGWTLNDVRTCCWDVRTDSTWNSSKLLDTKEGSDGKFSSSGRNIMSSERMQGIRFLWIGIWAESSRNKALKMIESLIKSNITWKWFCPTECSQLYTNTKLS